MTHRAAVLFLLFAAFFPGRGESQTLDEVERPLLPKGQTTLSADYGQFAYEYFVAGLGFTSYSYFQPAQHVLLSTAGLGASKSVQLNLSGTYLLPTSSAFELFPDPDSTIITRSLVKSLAPAVIVRRGSKLELHIAGMTARARFDQRSPTGAATAVTTTFDTDALQVRGTWLPHPDADSRPRRADLDGLVGPLLRKHRAAIRWDGLWRRYRSTDSEVGPVSGRLVDTVRSTDARLRLGSAYGASDRTQISGDVYWQPPFNVSESDVARDFVPGEVRVADYSRRLSSLYGWRLDERWRLAERFEAGIEGIFERQSVRQSPQTPSALKGDYRQQRLSTSATWLSRPRAPGAPLTADVSGLYGPQLEKHQFRLDAAFRYFRNDEIDPGGFRFWRVDASMGLLSSLEGSVYAGALDGPVQFFERRSSFGASLRFRPSRWVGAYATLNYHPSAWMTEYPAFVLPQGSFARAYQDLLNTTYDGDASIHVGVRFVLK